jgi:hypothetical protein
MEMLSLATMTRVDATLPRGRVHIKKGMAVFHSEAERRAWLQSLVTHYMEQAEDRLIEELLGPRYEPEEELC